MFFAVKRTAIRYSVNTHTQTHHKNSTVGHTQKDIEMNVKHVNADSKQEISDCSG